MIIAPFTMDPANLPTFSQRNPGLGDLQRCIGRGEGFDAPAALADNVIKPLMWFTAGAAAAAAAELGGPEPWKPGTPYNAAQQEVMAAITAAKRAGGLSQGDALALLERAKAAGFTDWHEPGVHAARSGYWSTHRHISIAGKHILVR
jgi:hypothetical protein